MKMMNPSRIVAALFVGGLFLVGCQCGPSEPGAEAATVLVRVFDRCTANGSGTGPVAGATVTISAGNQAPTTTVTNAKGEVEFTGLISDTQVTVNAQATNGTSFPHKSLTTVEGQNVVVLCLLTGSAGGSQ